MQLAQFLQVYLRLQSFDLVFTCPNNITTDARFLVLWLCGDYGTVVSMWRATHEHPVGSSLGRDTHTHGTFGNEDVWTQRRFCRHTSSNRALLWLRPPVACKPDEQAIACSSPLPVSQKAKEEQAVILLEWFLFINESSLFYSAPCSFFVPVEPNKHFWKRNHYWT